MGHVKVISLERSLASDLVKALKGTTTSDSVEDNTATRYYIYISSHKITELEVTEKELTWKIPHFWPN